MDSSSPAISTPSSPPSTSSSSSSSSDSSSSSSSSSSRLPPSLHSYFVRRRDEILERHPHLLDPHDPSSLSNSSSSAPLDSHSGRYLDFLVLSLGIFLIAVILQFEYRIDVWQHLKDYLVWLFDPQLPKVDERTNTATVREDIANAFGSNEL